MKRLLAAATAVVSILASSSSARAADSDSVDFAGAVEPAPAEKRAPSAVHGGLSGGYGTGRFLGLGYRKLALSADLGARPGEHLGVDSRLSFEPGRSENGVAVYRVAGELSVTLTVSRLHLYTGPQIGRIWFHRESGSTDTNVGRFFAGGHTGLHPRRPPGGRERLGRAGHTRVHGGVRSADRHHDGNARAHVLEDGHVGLP